MGTSDYIYKDKIAILMSTYNGGQYLQVQIESLLSQTNQNWILFVRDDGSKDNTVEIIRSYQKSHDNIIYIEDNLNLGACKSFLYLLDLVDADYYMFCDQDDVWLPTKIERTIKEMLLFESATIDTPIVVCTDLSLVDSDLNIIQPSMWKYAGLLPRYLKKWKFLQVCNIFTGCTMMINRAAKQISLSDSSRAKMHDSWIGLSVSAHGGYIATIEEPMILYRQHSSNVLGSPPHPGKTYYLKKLKSLKKIWSGIYSQYKVADSIRHTSLLHFCYYKIMYQVIRLIFK